MVLRGKNLDAYERWKATIDTEPKGSKGLGYLTDEEYDYYFQLGQQQRLSKEEEKKAKKEAEKAEKELEKELENQALREKYGIDDPAAAQGTNENESTGILGRAASGIAGGLERGLDFVQNGAQGIMQDTPVGDVLSETIKGLGRSVGVGAPTDIMEMLGIDPETNTVTRGIQNVDNFNQRALDSASLNIMSELGGEEFTTGNKGADFVADMLGFAAPGAASYKAARAIPQVAKMAQNTSRAGRIAGAAGEGAVAGGIFSAGQSAIQEAGVNADQYDLEHHLMQAGLNVGLGAGIDAAVVGAAPLLRNALGRGRTPEETSQLLLEGEQPPQQLMLEGEQPLLLNEGLALPEGRTPDPIIGQSDIIPQQRVQFTSEPVTRRVNDVDYNISSEGITLRTDNMTEPVPLRDMKVTKTGNDTSVVGSDTLKFSGKDEFVFRNINDLHASVLVDRARNVGRKITESWEKQLLQIRRSYGSAKHAIDNELAPIFRNAYKKKLKPEQVNDYITAVHIKDANKLKLVQDREKSELSRELLNIKEKIDNGTAKESDFTRMDDVEYQLSMMDDWTPPARFQDPEFVDRIVQEGSKNKALVKAQKEYVALGQKYFKMAYDEGLITKKFYENSIKKHPNYVPMRRVIPDDEMSAFMNNISNGRGTGVGSRKGGSDLEAINPVESMAGNIMSLQAKADMNKALRYIKTLADDPATSNLFKKLPKGKNSANSVGFYDGGNFVEYDVPPEIKRMVETFDYQGLGGDPKNLIASVKSWGKAVSQGFKRGTTDFNPLFHMKAFVRESQNAMATSNVNVRPDDLAIGLLDAMFGNKLNKVKMQSFREQYYASGGKYSGYIYAGTTDASKIASKIQTNSPILEKMNMLNPLRAVLALGQVSENAPRLAIMRAAEREGIKGLDAIYEAADVTNYLRSGHDIRSLNQYFPYLNPMIQGIDKQVRAFKNDPVKMAMRTSAYVVAPVVGAKMYNHQFATEEQKQKINHLQDWEKSMFFHIAHSNGENLIMIPKPYGLVQAVATPVERAADFILDNDPEVFEGMMGDIGSNFIPPTSAAIMSPFIEWWAEKDLFTGQDIVPRSMQGFSPEDQKDYRTLHTAVALGELIGVSPKKLDNTLRTVGGTMGDALLEFTEWSLAELGMLDEKPVAANTQMWEVFDKVFIRDEIAGSGVVSDLFDVEGELTGMKNAEREQLKNHIRQQDPLITNEELTSMLRPEQGLYEFDLAAELGAVGDVTGEFSDMSTVIRNIQMNPDMSREEKRRIIQRVRAEERNVADENAWMTNFTN